MSNEITTAHQIVHVLLEFGRMLVAGVIAITIGIWWLLHQRFATKKNMLACKNEVAAETDRDIKDLKKENTDEHKAIRLEMQEGFKDLKLEVGRILDHLLHHDK